MAVTLRLPYLACTECRSQIVSHPHVKVATHELLCLFCAVAHDRRGEGHIVAALHADSEGFCPHAAPTLDQDAAVELLIANGARPVR